MNDKSIVSYGAAKLYRIARAAQWKTQRQDLLKLSKESARLDNSTVC